MLLQDFTGVPCVVDLAAMRDAIAEMGGKPAKINPLQPVEIVIDHSVQVDAFGSNGAFERNAELEYERNGERYSFLKWGQNALAGFGAVPPDTGIVHQVNIEYLARIVFGAGVPAKRIRRAMRRWPIRIRWSAPTRTPRWPTASACWPGASAASRPRRRCSGSR